MSPRDLVLDPFVGAGTTLLAAKERHVSAIGYDISPLADLISRVKVHDYRRTSIETFSKILEEELQNLPAHDEKPEASADLLKKALPGDLLPVLSGCAKTLDELRCSIPERDFFKLALLAVLPRFSRAKATGGWLKWVDGGLEPVDVPEVFREQIQRMTADIPQHVGLGSKTALLMATGLVCNNLAGRPIGETQLLLASGRGGTSGVGVNTVFVGGFVVDGGHATKGEPRYGPSSAERATRVPPALVRLRFPDAWRVHLFLPKGYRYSGEREARFFEQNAPIGVQEVYEVLAAVYHGVVPAIAEADLELLRIAVQDVHRTGFKRRELDGQRREVRDLVRELQDGLKLAAGMSSLGPLVYAIAPAGRELAEEACGAVFRETEYLGRFCARNAAYELAET